jgi:predicted lactoylglutathione lyase
MSKLRCAIRLIEDNLLNCRPQLIGETIMIKMIFVSLPVTNLEASMTFYKSIGFVNNPHFSDDTSACMVWSETIKVMLLTHAKWRTFTTRPIPPATSSEAGFILSCENRESVDAMNEAAAANGGTADINPVQDLGFMYTRDMMDPDGHIWGAMWMDPAAIPSGDKGKEGCR